VEYVLSVIEQRLFKVWLLVLSKKKVWLLEFGNLGVKRVDAFFLN
jgi:hypothetical protein